MQSYCSYKDTGVLAIGSIPVTWNVKRAKYLFREVNERSVDGSETLLSVSEYYGVKPRSESIADNENLSRAETLEGYKKCSKDDFVMNIMLAWKCGHGVTSHDGIVSPAYSVFRPDKSKIWPQYAHYLSRTPMYTKYFKTLSTGIIDSRLRLYPDKFGTIFYILPSIEEQQAIASFLDRETARIDKLISEKQTFIKLLKEKRQSLISHAFRADNKSHRARLGYFVDLLPGYAFKSELFSESSSDVRLLRGANVGVGSLKWDDVVYWSLDNPVDVDAFALREGDIVFGMDRPWISAGARTAIVRQDDLPCYLVQRVARIRAKPDINQKYIYFALASEEFKVHAEADLTGLSVPHISPDQIKSFPIPALPKEEQELVVSSIERSTSRIDTIVAEVESSITLALEHRAALISAAVTGKIDVRNHKEQAA